MDNQIVLTEEMKLNVSKLEQWETKIRELKELEKNFDDAKKKLYDFMLNSGFDYYETNTLDFTLVKPSLPKTEILIDFDMDTFKKEQPEMYNKYLKPIEKTTKGRAGYLRMTFKKEEE